MPAPFAAIVVSAVLCAAAVHAQVGPNPPADPAPDHAATAPPAPAIIASDSSPTVPPQNLVLRSAPGASREQLPLGSTANSAARSSATPAAASRSDTTSRSPFANLAQLAVPLATVIGLIFAAAAVLRAAARRQGGLLASALTAGSPSGLLEVLARYPIARGHSLLLLKLDRRLLLISHERSGKLGTHSEMRTLCEISDSDEVAAILLKVSAQETNSLASQFQTLLSRERSDAPVPVTAPQPAWRRLLTVGGGDRVELLQTTPLAPARVPLTQPTRNPIEADATTVATSQRSSFEPEPGPHGPAVAAIRARLAQLQAQDAASAGVIA